MSTEAPNIPLKTHVGRARWDEHDYHGFELFGELAGKESFSSLVALAVSGRRVPPEDWPVLDDIAAIVGVADPSIWPLKITRVISSYGRVLPAMACASLLYESHHVGPLTAVQGAASLRAIHDALGPSNPDDSYDDAAVERAIVAYLSRTRRLAGFGVPFRAQDERLVALRKCITLRGRERKKFWVLNEKYMDVVRRERGLEPNVSIATCAVLLDLGFQADEVPFICYAFHQHAQLANAVEGARQAPEILRRLPPEKVRYMGVPPRASPRSRGL